MREVDILYFAWVREAVGAEAERVALDPDIASVTALMAHLVTRSVGHAKAFAEPARLRCALDQMMVGLDAPLGDAQEVAFFPPVTGG